MKNCLVFERLNFINCLYSVYRIIIFKEKIYFIETNIFLKYLFKTFKISISQLNIDKLSRIKKELSLDIEKQRLLNLLLDNLIINKKNFIKNFKEVNEFYLSRMVASFYYDKLNKMLNILLLIDNSKNNEIFRGKKIQLFFNYIPGFIFFSKNLNLSENLELKKNINFSSLYPFPILFLKMIFNFFISILWNIKIDKNKNLEQKILVQYQKNIFDRYPDAGPLFWVKKAKIKKNNIFIFSEKKISRMQKKEILNYGFNYEEITPNKISLFSPLKILITNLKKISFKQAITNYELLFIIIYIQWRIKCYEMIFLKLNVKMLNQYQEFSINALTKYFSLNMLNGVSFWMHWSVVKKKLAHYSYGFVDIVFSWGPNDEYFYKESNLKFKKMFHVGIINGDKIDYNNKNKNSYKKNNLIIFDTSHSNSRVFANTDMIKNFYRDLFTFFINSKKYSITIKSKGNSFEKIKNCTEIKSLYATLLKEKRLKIADSSLTPFTAANKSELSISFDYNTAGFLVGMSGIKSIFLNISRFDNYKFHDYLKSKNLSFNSVAEFLIFLEKNEINNISPFEEKFKENFDQYRDNFADERVAREIEKIFSYNKKNNYYRLDLNHKNYEQN